MAMGAVISDPATQSRRISSQYRFLVAKKKYYGARLDKFRFYNIIMESIIALGATGSGATGLAVLQKNMGPLVWLIVSIASISVAFLKPFLRIADKVEDTGKLFGAYAKASQSLADLVADLESRRMISEEDIKTTNQIRKQVG